MLENKSPGMDVGYVEQYLKGEELSRPIRIAIRNGEGWILEQLKAKAPELVEPLQTIFLLHFGNVDIKLRALDDEPEIISMDAWNKMIEKLSKFMSELPDSTETQDPPVHSEHIDELPPWMIQRNDASSNDQPG